jgi:hypothetical protein
MEKRTRNWVIGILAVLGVCALLVVGVVGTMAYFLVSHVEAGSASPTQVTTRFADVRQRFAGAEPIVHLDADEHAVVRPRTAEAPASGRPLKNLHVLVYDESDEQLVQVSVPFWLLRLLPAGKFSVSDGPVHIDSERLHLTVEELERYGPSLVLDHREQRGAQVIVWTE